MKQTNNTNVPEHIALIMDGNGRWAQARHLPRTVGHARGAAVVRPLLKKCIERGINCVTLFAFSTENWGRPAEEVSTLMDLFMQYLEREVSELAQAGVRFKVIGDLSAFPKELRDRITQAQERTSSNSAITLVVAANYGGRWDVLNSMRSLLESGQAALASDLTEDAISSHLSTAGLPELDFLIRTGGERRLSNFLLWQAAYAEIYFTDVLWPDFSTSELDAALDWFGRRERRFGVLA